MSSQESINGIINLVEYVNSIKDQMGLFCCFLIIKQGAVHVYIQDYYDNMCQNCGHEVGLEEYFNLTPVENDIYESKFIFPVSGLELLFRSKLSQALKPYGFTYKNGSYTVNYR